MNETRYFSPVVWLSFAAGVILLFLLGFAAWFKTPKANIVSGGLTLLQESRPKPVALPSSGANAEGLAIYHQSERDLASPRYNLEGMAIFHRSERSTTAGAQINAVGLDIYHQSERGSAVPDSIEEGMAIYLQSERNFIPVDPDSSTDEGMDIYHASEWGR